MGFMLVYPLISGLLARYLLPWIGQNYGFDFAPFTDLILVILLLIIPISYGALIGFSILEDRDDNVLINIRVTPLSIHQFLSFRLVAVYFICFLAIIFVICFSNIIKFTVKDTIGLAFLASLEAPISGLLINCFAKNKIEGFAIMKAGGSIIIFPIIALFITSGKELFFSFAPGFWPGKLISHIVRDGGLYLTYRQYYIIGFLYMIILNIFAYKLFINRIKAN